MQIRHRWGLAALAALGTLAVAGCGSSSSDSTARIRSADYAVNGITANVTVNTAVNGGDLNQSQSTPYNFIGAGLSDFGFITTATLPADIATVGTPPDARLQLNNGSFYSAYLIGRADLEGKKDSRFLQTVVTGDRGAAAAYTDTVKYAAPPSGQANVRVLNAAPDAGFTAPNTTGAVDVLINGKVAYPAVAYPPLLIATGAVNSASVAYAPASVPVTPYLALPSGTISVQVNLAGTSTVIVPPTNVSVSGGSAYTLIVSETAITPAYTVTVQND